MMFLNLLQVESNSIAQQFLASSPVFFFLIYLRFFFFGQLYPCFLQLFTSLSLLSKKEKMTKMEPREECEDRFNGASFNIVLAVL